jgi:translation initiation factor IF-3
MIDYIVINNDYSKLANNELKINEQIRAKEVRLIGKDGEMLGVVSTFRAVGLAREEELDLVEISPNSVPPVCKIANYGKIRYQIQKKTAEAKKKQKVVETKEIKMSLNIAQGDYNTKLKQSRKFFEQGNKVRFSFQFRGREITHSDLFNELAEKIILELSDVSKVELKPQIEGKKLFFVLSSSIKK